MDLAKIESGLYWVVFTAGFLGVALWESRVPHAPLQERVERRWKAHGALFLAQALVTGLVLRVSPVYYAIVMEKGNTGLFKQSHMPALLQFFLGILALDLVSYLVHRLFHSVGFLWRVHEIHHSDRDYDVSTAARFHPLEVLATGAAQLLAIRLLAPSPLCVLTAVLLSIALNIFVHANGSLPPFAERVLRGLVVTPDLHRLHHSSDPSDFDRNFGQIFSFWDRLFNTWREPSSRMYATGVSELTKTDTLAMGYLLTAPFRRRPSPVLPSPEHEHGNG